VTEETANNGEAETRSFIIESHFGGMPTILGFSVSPFLPVPSVISVSSGY